MTELSGLVNAIIIIDWLLMATLIVAGGIIYHRVVLRALEEFSDGGVMEFLPSRQWRQCREYKRICDENGIKARYWGFIRAFPFLGLLLLLIWIGPFLMDILEVRL